MEWRVWEGAFFDEEDILFFDSLYFDRFEAFPNFFERSGKKFFLLHYLSSFYPRDECLLRHQLRVLEGFDAVICTGQAVFRKLSVLNPSLSLLFWPPEQKAPKLLKKRGLSAGKNIVLWVCSLQEVKGVLPLLEALGKEVAALRRGCTEVWMVGSLEGDGDYARRCRRLIVELSREGVLRHWGPQSYESLEFLYAEAGLLLSVSFFETFGMAVQEACLRSLPVWALEADYLRWHEERGELRVFSSVSDLAKALGSLKVLL